MSRELRRRAHAGAAGIKAGGGLDEVGACLGKDFGGLLDLVHGQSVGLHDGFDGDAVLVANVHNGLYVRAHLVPHAAAYPAVICDDVQLENVAALAVFLGLEHLGGGGRKAEGEVADDADLGICPAGQLGGDVERGGVHADRGAAVVHALLNVAAYVLLGELGLEHGLVYIGGQLLDAHLTSFFCRFHIYCSFQNIMAALVFGNFVHLHKNIAHPRAKSSIYGRLT